MATWLWSAILKFTLRICVCGATWLRPFCSHLGRDVLCEYWSSCSGVIGSKYASIKVCPQCTAAVPVRRKTCLYWKKSSMHLWIANSRLYQLFWHRPELTIHNISNLYNRQIHYWYEMHCVHVRWLILYSVYTSDEYHAHAYSISACAISTRCQKVPRVLHFSAFHSIINSVMYIIIFCFLAGVFPSTYHERVDSSGFSQSLGCHRDVLIQLDTLDM